MREQPVTPRQSQLADNLSNPALTVKESLLLAGYSVATANTGMNAIPQAVLKLMAKKGLRLRVLGEIDADTQEKLVRGRLVYNTIRGKDSGVLSAKALGSDRRVNMFQPDVQMGVVVLTQPGIATIKSESLLEKPADSE